MEKGIVLQCWVFSGINTTTLLSHCLTPSGNGRNWLTSPLLLMANHLTCTGLSFVPAANISRLVMRVMNFRFSYFLFWVQDLLTSKSNIEKQIIIFLKDVSYSNLKALVDYMYKVPGCLFTWQIRDNFSFLQGEVRINEDQLDSFLDTAKSLGIRGLMGETKKNEDTVPAKRRRSHSSEVASDHEASQPTPTVSRRRISTSKPFDVKSEPPSQASSHFQQEVDVRESLTQPSSIQSSQELDEEDLDLFQPCDIQSNHMNNLNHHTNHQGPSRQPTQELHPPSQGNNQLDCYVLSDLLIVLCQKQVMWTITLDGGCTMDP